MRKIMFLMPVLFVALVMVGCAKPPQAEIDAAKGAVQSAVSAEAADYAGSSLQAAQDAVAQLDQELKAQEEKFALFRSYKKASELAASAKAAGEKAAADADAGKAAAKAECETMMAEAGALVAQVKEMIDKAPRGKGTQADLEMLKSDLAGVESSLADAQNSFNAEKYLDAKSKIEAAMSAANNVKTAIEEAMAAKGRK